VKLLKLAGLACLAASLSGCVSVIEGTHQQITVATTPSDASCVFMRHGEQLGRVDHTPGSLIVKKTKYDIDITCDKTGFRPTSFNNHSGVSSLIAGNIVADLVLTAGVSSIVDSATGADNQYQDVVMMTLIPAPPQPAGNAPAGASQIPVAAKPSS
jgi:hypothetical protein